MPGFPPLLLMMCWLLSALAHTAHASQVEAIGVMVSIPPQKYFVERIGGERVEVAVMVGPGQNPATYEPLPRQLARLQKTRLYYRIGVPFETVWMSRIEQASPAMSVLDARQGLTLRRMESANGVGQGNDHGHNGQWDPHIWLSPALVREMAARLRDRLIELDPFGERQYHANYLEFANELDRLDRAIRSRLAGLENRTMMVFHPSWGYFADEFGLRQIAIEVEGKEPGGRRLAGLVERASREGLKTLFVQRQFSTSQAEAVAKAVGARVVVIDPLAEAYPDNLLRVAQAIAEGR